MDVGTSDVSAALLEAGGSRTIHNVRYRYQPEVVAATCFVAFSLCPPGTGYGSIPHFDTLLAKTTVAPRRASVPGQGRTSGPRCPRW